MRFLIAFVAVVASLAGALASEPLRTKYFSVPWDHSDPTGDQLSLHYSVAGNEDSLNVFVNVNDEYQFYGGGSSPSILEGTLGERHKAVTYYLSPRGYSMASIPKERRSLVTVAQSIHDLEKFVTEVVLKDKKRKEIIMVGNGLGGTIAGFYHQESYYTAGAILDTPRVVAPLSHPDWYTNALKALPSDCATNFGVLSDVLAAKMEETDPATIRSDLNLCSKPDLASPRLRAFFWHSLMFRIARAVGFSLNRSPKQSATLDAFCARISVPEAKMWNVFRQVLAESRESSTTCHLVDYVEFVDRADNDAAVSLAMSCTELAAFPTSLRAGPWMPDRNATIDLPFFGDLCQSFLGSKFDLDYARRGAAAFEHRFGGAQYKGLDAFVVVSKLDSQVGLAPTGVVSGTSSLLKYGGHRGELLLKESTSDSSELKDLRFTLNKFVDRIFS